jgi:hypothetical protein
MRQPIVKFCKIRAITQDNAITIAVTEAAVVVAVVVEVEEEEEWIQMKNKSRRDDDSAKRMQCHAKCSTTQT